MRGFAAVFGREVQERRLVFLGAFLLGLVPVVLPFVPGVGSGHASDLRQAVAAGLVMIAGVALSVLFGATAISSELAAGRMSFYFSRPLPAWTVWGGKLSALLALALAATLLVALPTLLIEGFGAAAPLRPEGSWLDLAVGADSLLPFVGLLALLLLGSHFLSVSFRSRSPWLALDLLGLAVTVAVVLAVWRYCRREGLAELALFRIPQSGGTTILGRLFGGLGLALLLALLLAAALQVSRGRIDGRRGHRVQSLVLWGLVAVILAGLAGAARWAVAATPADLAVLQLVRGAPRGPWLAVHGPIRHRPAYFSTFVVNPETGRFHRTRAALLRTTEPEVQFTADGRLAYWFEPQDLPGSALELKTLDLVDPAAQPRATGATFTLGTSGARLDFLLSPDGRRLAVCDGQRLTVEDLPTRALLLAKELGRDDPYYARVLQFDGPDRLRLDLLNQYLYRFNLPGARLPRRWEERFSSPEDRVRIDFYEGDLTQGTLTRTRSVASALVAAGWERSPDGERGVVLGREATEVVDTRSGERLATIPGRTIFVRFVPGGIVVARRAEAGLEILLFDRDGRQERSRLALPGHGWVALAEGEEGSPPRLFVQPGTEEPRGVEVPWRSWRIDMERGTFAPLPDRRLVLLAWGVPWNPAALRQADGVATFATFSEGFQIYLRPGH